MIVFDHATQTYWEYKNAIPTATTIVAVEGEHLSNISRNWKRRRLTGRNGYHGIAPESALLIQSTLEI